MDEELARRLESIYEVFPWPEDMEALEGRIQTAYEIFQTVLDHPWLQELVRGRDGLVVVDVCGGAGVGGVGLARVLIEKGKRVQLYVNDLRSTALEKARILSRKVLGLEAKTIRADATRIHEYIGHADIALVYGYSTPHFNPYQMVRLASSLAWILRPDGILLVEEGDRIYNVLVRGRYEDVLAEYADEDRIVLTVHSSYEPRTGVFRRVLLELPTGRKALMEVRFWDIASTAAIMWAFFEDVDFIPTRSSTSGMIVAHKPRGIPPENYSKNPSITGQ